MNSRLDQVHVVFGLGHLQYAVAAGSVCEIVELPELSPVAQAPAYIAGVFNWRGRIVPVMDLDLRMGSAARTYRLSDKIIILQHGGLLVGILADDLCDVCDILPAQVKPPPTFGHGPDATTRFVVAVAQVENDLVMLLDLDQVTHLPESFEPLPSIGTRSGFEPIGDSDGKRVLRERAFSLRQVATETSRADARPLAIVRLGVELFGVELNLVREFANLPEWAVLPGCPPHIVGVINLRGDLMTLVDIRGILNLPAGNDLSQGKILVVDFAAHSEAVDGSGRFGIWVDDVVDVVHVRTAELGSVQGIFLDGSFTYGSGIANVLDLAGMVRQQVLTVNDQV